MFPCAPFSDIQAMKHEFPNMYFSAIINDLMCFDLGRMTLPDENQSIGTWHIPIGTNLIFSISRNAKILFLAFRE